MQPQGVEGMSVRQVEEEVARGGRFVMFTSCISFLVITLRRPTGVYTLLSLALGWWGFGWGFIYTPMAVFEKPSGGKVVTAEVMESLSSGARG
jgi:hypothetical protein